MELNYDKIREIYREEKNNLQQLVELPPNFYSELREFIIAERKAYLESLKDFSIAKTRNFANLKKMVEEILAIRQKKILSMALISSRGGESLKKELPVQEDKIYKNVVSLLKTHNEFLEELFAEKGTKEATQHEKSVQEIRVKIETDIPAFVGTDMREYGPYTKGQVVSLPYKVAKLLLSRNLAKEE